MSKQDRQGVRKAADLEQKYSFGKVFSAQARLNESQEQEMDSQRLTLSQFISYATQAIDTLKKDVTAVNKTITSLSDKDTEIQNQVSSYWETVYPVGAVYISLSATNPKTLFGGEWEQLEGRFLLGASPSYSAGSIGGEAEHTLTIDEMPAHTHAGVRRSSANEGTVSTGSSTSSKDATYETDSTGGDQPHNNMPPYLAVYMWERTA